MRWLRTWPPGRDCSSTRERSLEVLAADVVEVHVDAAVALPLPELLDDRAVVVIEGRVEAQFQQAGHLVRGPGAADDPGCPHGLGDLADERPDGSGGAGDEDDVARLEVGDLEQPE